MNLHACYIRNFRRLKDVHLDFEKDLSIFVGANNSGKTSAAHAIQMFVAASKDKFSIHDFSADCWRRFDEIGDADAQLQQPPLPCMSVDLWFEVITADLHRVIDLLPSLTWAGARVGLRIEFAPADEVELLKNFREARAQATATVAAVEAGTFHPWPKSLTDYLVQCLAQSYEFRYYVLDEAQFDSSSRPAPDYVPQRLVADATRSARQIVDSLLRVDCLSAQRHLSDVTGGRAEDLSKRLSRFYKRNLEQRESDYDTLRALFDSEASLDKHLANVFAPTLRWLA